MNIVLDSHYAPNIAWWALAIRADEVLIEQHSYLRKGSYRNRCHIYGANGMLRLSVPIVKGNKNRSTMQSVNISYDHEWQKMHWESLCSAYRSSPFFEYYEDEFEGFYSSKVDSLLDFNLKLTQQIAELLGVNQSFQLTDQYGMSYDEEWLDVREIIHPNENKNGIKTWFDFPKYLQVFNSKWGFISNLSILDALFNLGPATLAYLENEVVINLPSSYTNLRLK